MQDLHMSDVRKHLTTSSVLLSAARASVSRLPISEDSDEEAESSHAGPVYAGARPPSPDLDIVHGVVREELERPPHIDTTDVDADTDSEHECE